MLLRPLVDEAAAFVDYVRRSRERMARAERQSLTRWQVLDQGGRTVPQIARRLGLTRQSVQRTADILAEQGLARFEANPNHRRSPVLVLTEPGQNLLERLERRYREWLAELSQLVEPEEIETTQLALRALRETSERPSR